MSIALSVNLNKIALLRNSRPGNFPDVVAHGRLCLDSGAHGLTVHPRPDQRHIRPTDVWQIAELVKTYPGTEFNIEGNPFAPRITGAGGGNTSTSMHTGAGQPDPAHVRSRF